MRNKKMQRLTSHRRRVWKRRLVAGFLLSFICVGTVFAKDSGLLGYHSKKFTAKDNQQIEDAIQVDMTGYQNIALFGVDSRDQNLDRSNSDTIMILSIDYDADIAKLISVYRDTYLDIGDDSYRKCNAAYMKGGPAQAITMLNRNLDLDITDYVSVDFDAVAVLVDTLGGIDLSMSAEEAKYVNMYCIETSEVTDMDYDELPEKAGTYHLNGVQAVSYCRIRYTAGNDMKRTERQRTVLSMLYDKVKDADAKQIYNIIKKVLPLTETSLDMSDLVKIGTASIGMDLDSQQGFPYEYGYLNLGKKGDVVVPADLEHNVKALHQYLFDDAEYEPSETVTDISASILRETGIKNKVDL